MAPPPRMKRETISTCETMSNVPRMQDYPYNFQTFYGGKPLVSPSFTVFGRAPPPTVDDGVTGLFCALTPLHVGRVREDFPGTEVNGVVGK